MNSELPTRAEKNHHQAGYSLIELVIVVFILGAMAAVVIPDFSSTDPAKLDLAFSEVMQAIRIARSESIRTGEMHGLTISQVTQKIKVNKYDLSTAPVSTDFTLTHPIEKQVYEFNINTDPMTRHVEISNTLDAFLYSDSQRRKSLLFDRHGTPVWFFGSTDAIYQLVDGTIQLSYGGQTRTILAAPLTGRVSEL